MDNELRYYLEQFKLDVLYMKKDLAEVIQTLRLLCTRLTDNMIDDESKNTFKQSIDTIKHVRFNGIPVIEEAIESLEYVDAKNTLNKNKEEDTAMKNAFKKAKEEKSKNREKEGKEFSLLINNFKETHKLTNQEICDLLEISSGSLYNYLNKGVAPRKDIMERVYNIITTFNDEGKKSI